MERGPYKKKIDDCVYPDCFHCILPDCEVAGTFPGESKKNAICGELPGSGEKSRREQKKRENHYSVQRLQRAASGMP